MYTIGLRALISGSACTTKHRAWCLYLCKMLNICNSFADHFINNQRLDVDTTTLLQANYTFFQNVHTWFVCTFKYFSQENNPQISDVKLFFRTRTSFSSMQRSDELKEVTISNEHIMQHMYMYMHAQYMHPKFNTFFNDNQYHYTTSCL